MGFSAEWDQRFKENTHNSIWPWSDLVSYFYRYSDVKNGRPLKILELGSGAGANIPFFGSFGAQIEYWGCDGSLSVISRLKSQYPKLRDRLSVCDFTSEKLPTHDVDIVIDRAAITHNSTEAIVSVLQNISESLAPGGAFIGIDWFSVKYSEFRRGQPTEDPFTRTNYVTGPFANLGRVHFSDQEHIKKLFEDFQIEVLEHKVIEQFLPDPTFNFASWNIVARKG